MKLCNSLTVCSVFSKDKLLVIELRIKLPIERETDVDSVADLLICIDVIIYEPCPRA